MKSITITSKRQATIPKEVCDELGIGPGDELQLERATVDGDRVWILRSKKPDWSWAGMLKNYASSHDHDWHAIEASIAKGIGDDTGT